MTAESSKLVLPWPAYRKYFRCLNLSEAGNYVVSCNSCVGKTLSVSKSSPTNMLRHIERKHPSQLSKFLQERQNVKRRAATSFAKNDNCGNPAKKQLLVSAYNTGRHSSEEMFEKALLAWVVDSAQPFCEVERESFRKLMMVAGDRSVMSTKALVNRIEVLFKKTKAKLIEEMESASCVGTTADVWTSFRRTFVGVTVHWLDTGSLERRDAVLACRRFVGQLTHDAIAELLHSIFVEYCIQNKVTSCVTNNVSDMVKASRCNGWNENSSTTTQQAEAEDEDECIEIVDTANILEDKESLVGLPPHERCASHTLTQVAENVAEARKVDGSYKEIYGSTFAKCTSIWTKQSTSPPLADKIKEKLGRCLVVPSSSRWSSTYDSVVCFNSVLSDREESVHQLFDAAGLVRLTSDEIKFLKEYVEVMEPLAKSIDILQGDKVSFGFLLPTLTNLLECLDKKDRSGLFYCGPLVTAIQIGVQQRFQNTLWEQNHVISSCLHPRLKLKWIRDPDKHVQAQEWVVEAAKVARDAESVQSGNTSTSTCADEFGGFFQFESEGSVSDECHQIKRWLHEPTTPHIQESLRLAPPVVKRMFVKYNTGLTSSAAAQRLFSTARDVFSSQRTSLASDYVEMQLLLKANLKT